MTNMREFFLSKLHLAPSQEKIEEENMMEKFIVGNILDSDDCQHSSGYSSNIFYQFQTLLATPPFRVVLIIYYSANLQIMNKDKKNFAGFCVNFNSWKVVR